MKLTVEQAAAVMAEQPRFAVRAGAGSGKTSVLVDRYIRHVVELGHSPDEIVTLTFTRKAAAVMKTRIVAQLKALGRPDDAQAAETGPIQTIHSFCERILRENAVEAMVDPEFTVLEGAKARSLSEQAVRYALVNAKDESAEAASLVSRFSGKAGWNEPAVTHGRIRSLVDQTMAKLRGSGISRDRLASVYSEPGSVLSYWAAEALSSLGIEASEGLETVEAGWGDRVAERLKSRGERPPAWLKGQLPAHDNLTASDAVGLVRLVVSAWEWLENEMSRLQEFDFTLLESKGIRLVEESMPARERIQRQCRAMLVDEAQDLNPLQYRLIDSVQSSSEMMVGDPQQSIYGFRFADRSLFVERCGSVETFNLSVNHRSAPGILRFVDEVFVPLWGDGHVRAAPIDAGDDDPFGPSGPPDCAGAEVWPLEDKDTASVANLIHQMVKDGELPSSIAVLTRSNSYVNALADRLTALGVPHRSVGASEKFFTRLEVRDLSNAFEALCDPYEDYSLLALLHSPFVGLSLDAIVWLASQSPVVEALDFDGPFEPEDKAKVAAFRSWYSDARTMADRVPAWETMAFLLRATPYVVEAAQGQSARQTLANLRKLFAMVSAEPELNARDFARRVREVQFLRHREGDAPVLDDKADAVTLMTIHRAKGLEFDVVVLPDTFDKLKPRSREVIVDAQRAMVVPRLGKTPSVFYKWLVDSEGAKSRDEELRVLYVGMTRAKRRLCVVVDETGNDLTPAGIVASAAGLPKNILPGLRVRRLSERA